MGVVGRVRKGSNVLVAAEVMQQSVVQRVYGEQGMGDLARKRAWSRTSFGQGTLDADAGDLLDCVALSISTTFDSDDTSVDTLAEFFDEFVLGTDDEC